MERGFQITSSQMPEQNPGRGIPALQQPLQKPSLLQVPEMIQKLNNRTSLEKERDLWRSWEGK
uniref:Uncharacterized protein n=1 Tax=Castor canadensis TaxID=51338 RepID=A0A8C0ZLQ7_CASCN